MTEPDTVETDTHYADAVNLMTAAARRHDSRGHQTDFAEFIAHVLAATAANLGGPDYLLAGRPESWEAELVHSLVQGTMGDDPASWLQHRTEPLTVALNVAELIETHPDHVELLGLDDAVEGVLDHYPFEDIDGTPIPQTSHKALAADLDAIDIRYRVEYRLYADDFTATINREAERLHLPGPSKSQPTPTPPHRGGNQKHPQPPLIPRRRHRPDRDRTLGSSTHRHPAAERKHPRLQPATLMTSPAASNGRVPGPLITNAPWPARIGKPSTRVGADKLTLAQLCEECRSPARRSTTGEPRAGPKVHQAAQR